MLIVRNVADKTKDKMVEYAQKTYNAKIMTVSFSAEDSKSQRRSVVNNSNSKHPCICF